MSTTTQNNRIDPLDYLRGIIALCILFYHYSLWYNGVSNKFIILNFVGLYGVSMFYLLSGLTLFKVYNDRPINNTTFFIKRIFRIFPLMWVVTIISIFLFNKEMDATKLFLNFTGLFGLFDWNNYIAVGAWSIGNELGFYLTFPLQLYLINNKPTFFFILYGIQAILYGIFAFVWLTPTIDLPTQWDIYINPINQVFLFSTGILIGKYFNFKFIQKIPYFIFIPLTTLLILIYVNHNFGIQLVSQYYRIFLTTLSVIIVVYFLNQVNFKWFFLHVGLKTIGEMSYSIYLLHPIIYFTSAALLSKLHLMKIHPLFHFVCASILTLTIGYFVFEYFEKYFIKKGNQLCNSLSDKKK